MISLEWILAIVITLFIIDIFVSTEYLTWIAILLFSTYVTWKMSPPWHWAILIFILISSILIVLYYLFLRKIIKRGIEKTVMQNQNKDILEAISGKTGIIHIVDGKIFVKLNDELWQIANADQEIYSEGEKVVVTAVCNGKLNVKKADDAS